MDKIISLPAGKDKLIVQSSPDDWCPVLVVTPNQKRLLGKEGWEFIIKRLLHGLEARDLSKDPQCILMVSEPHGAAHIQNKGNHYSIFFQGKDAPRVFHTMNLSKAEKQHWLDILQKEANFLK